MALTAQARPSSLKRSHFDMRETRPPTRWIDIDYYHDIVLRLPATVSEADLDRQLKHEADDLGISRLHITTDVERVTVSLSATTIASEPTNQSSILSRSTAPTSCSSSEHRPVTSSTHRSDTLPSLSVTPTILVDIEKKRKSGFRHGIRKMTGFSRKRKSPMSSSLASSPALSFTDKEIMTRSELVSLRSPRDTDIDLFRKDIDAESLVTSMQRLPIDSPSLRSSKSSDLWSQQDPTAVKFNDNTSEGLIDHEALQRTIESSELSALRARQLEEKQRFLDYQSQIIVGLHDERDTKKAGRQELHAQVVIDQIEKNERAVDDLESRQLEEELKLIKDQEHQKRAILARLRHMEAYCQNPSPPSSPVEATFIGSERTSPTGSVARGSADSIGGTALPQRRVTDRDYHNLASCYRERNAMDNLHVSKINVLRGKQKRAVENFIAKREKDMEQMEAQHVTEMDAIDFECGMRESECRAEFWAKRQVLERRWKLQSMIEKTRCERTTGLKHEDLPPITLADAEAVHGLGIAK